MAQEVALKLDFEPRPWQQKAFDSLNRFTIIAVHRRAGKTHLAVIITILNALKKPGLYLYVAPEKRQAKSISWGIFKQYLKSFMDADIGNGKHAVEAYEADLELRFWNGSVISMQGADDPNRMRGFKVAGCIIDETAQVPREVWTDILLPAMLDSMGFAVCIGTPCGINLFSELYDHGLNSAPEWSEYSSLKFTCYETDALDPKAIEGYRQTVADNTFRREMLCDFGASAEDQLISLDEIREAASRTYDPSVVAGVPLVMAVDVARYGDDSSAITFRQGLIAEQPIVLRDCSLVELAGAANELAMKRHPRTIFVDGTGIGGGCVDIMRNMGLRNVIEVNFTAKSPDPICPNMRSYMWVKLAEWIKKGSIPNDEQLKKELAMPCYTVNEKQQKELEQKKKIKERLKCSPDMADSLALTFAAEIAPEEQDPVKRQIDELERQAPVDPITRFEKRFEKHRYVSLLESRYARASIYMPQIQGRTQSPWFS